MSKHVAVLGASGFVGSAVVAALREHDAEVIELAAPRVRSSARDAAAVLREAEQVMAASALAGQVSGCDVVINAAGDPDASAHDEDGLVGANAVVPAVALLAAKAAGVSRYVHISSAVVQNDKPVLDESEELLPFSAYSRSKVLGEEAVRSADPGPLQVVRFRPPSVHANTRRVSRGVGRIARSAIASVAGDGNQPTPQALVGNVASAIAFLALTPQTPAPVVIHPFEGLTARELMEIMGCGRRPKRVPRGLARGSVRVLKAVGRRAPTVAANARRLEILWLGQGQAESWLTTQGWTLPLGRDAWRELALDLTRTAHDDRHGRKEVRG